MKRKCEFRYITFSIFYSSSEYGIPYGRDLVLFVNLSSGSTSLRKLSSGAATPVVGIFNAAIQILFMFLPLGVISRNIPLVWYSVTSK